MENKYSLTFPQKNIWMVEKFFGRSNINTIVGIFNVNKGFNVDLCKKAINKAIELNDALRLTVREDEDEVYQYIEGYKYYDADFFDLTSHNNIDKSKLDKKLLDTPFEVLGGKLYYFAIVKESEEKGYIFTKLHHLVSDAWTYGNMASSLSEYIEAFSNGVYEFEVKPSYTEFIKSENEYINSDRFEKDRSFWKEYLKGLEESVGLKEVSDDSSICAKRYTVSIDEKLNSNIKAYCKINRVSPYTLFMVSLAIYIHRTREKNDFVIGTPVLNRSNARDKKMMGMFVSTMPVRFVIDENKTFLEMCREQARDTMSLFRHQKYPYSLIVEEHKKTHDMKSNLYEVMVSYQNARAEYFCEDKYSTSWLFSDEVQDQFAIHIMDMDETGVLQVHFDYLTNLFEQEEIKYIASRLFEIMRDGIENNKRVFEIDIMTEEEKIRILNEFNNTKRNYPSDKTVIQVFRECVRKNPSNTALVFEDKTLTYSELDELSNAYANYLKGLGIKGKDKVGILIDKSVELIACIIALLKLGVCYVPVEKNFNKERKNYILNNAECTLVITDSKEEVDIQQIDVHDIETNNIKEVINICTPDNANCVLYTSGTTGEPKGAIVVDRNITKLVCNPDYITFTSDDEILQAASTSFDVSIFEIWGALLNGAKLHVIKKENLINPAYLKDYLEKNKITILWITSALFNQMIEADATMFKHLRRIFTGGDVISLKHVNILMDSCPNLLITNCYGPTECVAFTNTCDILNKPTKRIPLGKPISNTVGYVMDSKCRLLPLYVPGEYVIGGECVTKGYINNPELTKQKFIPNSIDDRFSIDRLYKTGDIVQMLGDGKIDFIGRRDNQIKIRGYRIELDEIKIALQSYNKVRDAVAIVKEQYGIKQIYAYYTSDEKEINESIKEYLKQKLPSYMVPAKLLQLEKIPINNNGKIDRKNLPDIEDRSMSRTEKYEYEGIYKIIYGVYKEILGISEIAPTDSFFDIGGDSISVIKIISKLSRENIAVTFQDIYKYPSIQELGDMLKVNHKADSISSGLSKFNYDQINKLLSQNLPENVCETEDIYNRNILLTGATGFLGAHILYKYLQKNKEALVYCIVRRKGEISPQERLKDRLDFFFGKDYYESIKNRVKVVEGDTILPGIFINDADIEDIKKNVKIIINSAAYVKHYGKLELFEKINTTSVETLAKFALENNMELVQISTLSVSGNILENGQLEQKNIPEGTVYDETNFFVGQNLDNVYAYTKFMAEKIVYDYIISKGLKGKIIRMGNLTGRISDGKFQPNVEENAFAQRLKTIINLGVLPNNLISFDVEFTPVDCAAEAIVILTNMVCSFNTFHLFNDNHIKMSKLKEVFKEYGIVLKDVSKNEMTNLIKELIEENYSKVQGVVQDLNSNKELEYKANVKIKEEFTKKVLQSKGFKWPNIDDEYIKKYLDYLYFCGFLEEAKDES